MGWVSFFHVRELAAELGLPHLEVTAYLCLGYVTGFAPEPELASAAGRVVGRCPGRSTPRSSAIADCPGRNQWTRLPR